MQPFRNFIAKNLQQAAKFVRNFASDSSSSQSHRGLIVGAYDKDWEQKEDACIELSQGAYKIDQASGGKITNALNGLRGDICKLGKVTMLSNINEEFPLIAIAGLGKKNAGFSDTEYLDEEAEHIRIATGVGARELQRHGVNELVVEEFTRPEAAAEGSALGAWYYSDKPLETKLMPFRSEGNGVNAESEDDWLRGLAKADAQNIVRCLCETPPNFITPLHFAQRARDLLCPYGVQVFARDVSWLKANHMTGLLTVGSSSVEPPIFLVLNYCSDEPTAKPFIMIGQGATFNSGGLCSKNCNDMMEADFSSGAAILGVFKAVAGMRMPINLRAYIPLYEFMIGSMSMKAMDMVETHGQLIQTPHTNDFHQVTLAEATLHALKHHCPYSVFTLGSLSPVTKAFLGATTAVYARCDNMWEHINYAGAITGDRMWRMPLFYDYTRRVTECSAVDINNIGKGHNGEPCLIAAVLNKLTPPCIDFTYMDITGSSAISNGHVPYLGEGLFTGAPTRGLIQLLCHLDYCRKQTEQPQQSMATSGPCPGM